MTLLFVAIPVALVIAAVAVSAFAWAARDGQYEDLDTPPVRMLIDDAQVPGCVQSSDDARESGSG